MTLSREPASARHLRNVLLAGPAGSGKTTLVAGLTGGDTATTTPTQRLAVSTVMHGDTRINLLDSPGHSDFAGRVRAGLRACDAVLFVISAADGVDAPTRLLWEECTAAGMPRALVITKLDSPRADFDETVAICRRFLGGNSYTDARSVGLDTGMLPLCLPLADDHGGTGGIIDLLSRQVWDYTGQSGRRPVQPAPEHLAGIREAREDLVEAVLTGSEDDALLSRHLAGEDLDAADLLSDLAAATRRAELHPILPVSVRRGVGLPEVLELIVTAFPSPAECDIPAATTLAGLPTEPHTCDPDGPLLAEVVQLRASPTDLPAEGRSGAVVRVFSGRLRNGTTVHVADHRTHSPEAQDAGHISTGHISTGHISTGHIEAGDIEAGDVATVEASGIRTGSTLSETAAPLLLHPCPLPEPVHRTTLQASAGTSPVDLASAVDDLLADDPTLQAHLDPGARTLVLESLGEAHAEAATGFLRTRCGVDVVTHTEPA